MGNPIIRTFNFDWPTNGLITTRLRDVLEANVDERYYLSEDKTAKLIEQLSDRESDSDDVINVGYIEKWKQRGNVMSDTGVCKTVTAVDYKMPPIVKQHDNPILAGSLDHYGNDQMNRVYSVDGVSPTITVVSGGGREQKIAEPQIEKIGHLPSDSGQTGAVYDADGIAPTCLNQHGNAVTKIAELQQYSDGSGLAYTVDANYAKGTSPGNIGKGRRTHVVEEYAVKPRYRIRKLTPRECWRLQSFTDDQFDKAKQAGISDSQLYKMAGNAVTVNVINAIGDRLLPLITAKGDGTPSHTTLVAHT